MKNIVVKSIVSAALVATAGVSFAQAAPNTTFGVVISSTPVVQQVTVPKQICTTTTTQYVQPSGAGALIGAVVGGAVGNQFGRGDGRAIATVVGALGGGIVGNQIEAQTYPSQTYPSQNCRVENTVENRAIAQNVLYEYAGQRYTVQMPANGDFRPGSRLTLQVTAPEPQYQPPVTYYNRMYNPPVQTVTYVNPVAPVVYYYDTFAPTPRYVHYNSTYYAPRAAVGSVNAVRPVNVIRYDNRHDNRYDNRHWNRDDNRNWR